MKKIISVLLCILMLCTLTGCKKHTKEVKSSSNSTSKQTSEDNKKVDGKIADKTENVVNDTLKTSQNNDSTNNSEEKENTKANHESKEENTLPRADFDKMCEKSFSENYVCFPSVEVSEVDNEGVLSSNGGLLILEKTDSGYGMYIVEMEGTLPVKDKNKNEIKENDKIKINNAKITNKLINDIPSISVSESDIEIIN